MGVDLLAAALIASKWTGTALLDESLAQHATAACDVAFPSEDHHAHRWQAVFWWNGEIADTHVECIRLRRVFNRLRGCGDAVATTVTEVEFRSARKELKHRIRDSKAKCWTKLVRSVDDNPWGKPHNVVLRKLHGPPTTKMMEPSTV